MILPNLFQFRPSAAPRPAGEWCRSPRRRTGSGPGPRRCPRAGSWTRSRRRRAGAGHLGEDGHGVARGAGHDGDAHGEQHAAEQGLGEEGLELGRGAGTAKVEEDHVACEGERDQRREQVHVRTEDGVELDGAKPLEPGRLPNMSDTSVEMAIASHGHRMPLPRARNQPVM